MKSKFVKILLVLIVLALLIPYPTTSVPEWKVRVINKSGKSLANIEVRQTWSHGQGESIDTQISDEYGDVTFPARKQFLPLILRIPLRGLERLNYIIMPHGSAMGGRAYVWSAAARHQDWLNYYEGGEIKNILFVTK